MLGQPRGSARRWFYAWLELVHADDRERVLRSLSAAFRHASTWKDDYRLRRADGSYVWVQDTGVIARDAERPAGAHARAPSATSRRSARRASLSSRRRSSIAPCSGARPIRPSASIARAAISRPTTRRSPSGSARRRRCGRTTSGTTSRAELGELVDSRLRPPTREWRPRWSCEVRATQAHASSPPSSPVASPGRTRSSACAPTSRRTSCSRSSCATPTRPCAWCCGQVNDDKVELEKRVTANLELLIAPTLDRLERQLRSAARGRVRPGAAREPLGDPAAVRRPPVVARRTAHHRSRAASSKWPATCAWARRPTRSRRSCGCRGPRSSSTAATSAASWGSSAAIRQLGAALSTLLPRQDLRAAGVAGGPSDDGLLSPAVRPVREDTG